MEKRKKKCVRLVENIKTSLEKNPIREEIYNHSLLCCSNKKCNKVWSRDINGSLNILNVGLCILNNKSRPAYLERTVKD